MIRWLDNRRARLAQAGSTGHRQVRAGVVRAGPGRVGVVRVGLGPVGVVRVCSAWAGTAALIPALAVVAGCGPVRSAPVALPWRPVSLPSAGAGRTVLRDVTACAGRWYAVGGSVTAEGATPAVWSSSDGVAWRALPTQPVSLYGRQSVLSAVACRGGTVVALGAAAGGAHGNPRTATWRGDERAGLTENPTPVDLFGGDDAVGVGPLTAGPAGFLVGGGWVDADRHPGAAVWWSADGTAFQRVDADPALESGDGGARVLTGLAGVPEGFLAVGSFAPADGGPRQAQVWRSSDGRHWAADPVEPAGADAEPQALSAGAGARCAAGVLAAGFGVWCADAGRWRLAGRFGHGTGGTSPPRVTGLVEAGGVSYLVAGDGTGFGLWTGTDPASWRSRPLPRAVAQGGGRTVRIAAADDHLLLAVDDGAAAQLWLLPTR